MNSGFSLIEFGIYCALLALLVMVTFHGFLDFQRSNHMHQERAMQLASMHAATDILCRDISQAPPDQHMWSIADEQHIRWTCADGMLGFVFKDKKLERTFQSRDPEGNLRLPVSSLLLSNVEGSFEIFKQNPMVSAVKVKLMVTVAGRAVERVHMIALHGGVLS